MDGPTTVLEVKKLYPNIKVIMLSMPNDYSVISRMMEIGACSYLTKEAGSEMIYEAIKQVYEKFNGQVIDNGIGGFAAKYFKGSSEKIFY